MKGRLLEGYRKRELYSDKISLSRRDYRKCCQTKQEFLWCVLQSAGVVVCFAIFFYRSVWAVSPLAGLGVAYFRLLRRQSVENSRQQLLRQFKECMLSVATALRAGYAVENAFLESREDMRMLFGEKSLMYQELECIRRGLVINITLEELLQDLARRSNCPEIQQFSQVFAIAKRNGGNMEEIIGNFATMIRQRMDTKQEIETLLSGRRMEQLVMQVIPFGILLYIGITSPGYFDVLYGNWQGAAIMTGCLGVYLVAYVTGKKILDRIIFELMR